MIGPNVTPMTNMDMARAYRSGGLISSNVACDMGTNAAPDNPCSNLKNTSCGRLRDRPHSIDVTVNARMDVSNTLLRPMRPLSQPLSGIMIAVATM